MSRCSCQEAKPGKLIPVKRVGTRFYCTKCLTEIIGGTIVGQDNGMDLPGDVTVKDSLDQARDIIYNQRMDDYGKPENTFTKIAALWSSYLNDRIISPLTARDVASMMILMKVARGHAKRDNWVDIIGYAAIGADRL